MGLQTAGSTQHHSAGKNYDPANAPESTTTLIGVTPHHHSVSKTNSNTPQRSKFKLSNMLPTPTPATSSSPSASSSMWTMVKATLTILLLAQQQQHCLAFSIHLPMPHSSAKPTAITTTTTTTSTTTTRTSLAESRYGSVSPDEYRECNSMDIRNRCDNFYDLKDCTVITGYLILVLINYNASCNYSNYHFPKLREITDYILIHELRQVSTFRTIFPNLTVIRGRTVFVNYAIGISRMQSLEAIEFPSLIGLQRGHFFVGSNPRLCSLNTINFERLSLSPGENHVIPDNITCPSTESSCLGCDSGYCWSNKVCQKFENDNILNYQQGIQHCDSQCLGGCDNRKPQGCAVCRTWTDHGICVDKCPDDKYASEHFLRCYTREECIAKRQFIYKNQCVGVCPDGYKLNNATRECDSCGGVNECRRVCATPDTGINALADIELLRGCQILNGSVVMYLRYRINEQEFIDNLKDVREIMGYLKIYNSPHVSSLNFFQSLEKIHGEDLEYDHHSLILFNNANLEDIWSTRKNVELAKGGMYIYKNDRMCNRVLRNFKNSVKHDYSLDSIYMNDVEVLCSPEKLLLGVEVLSHRSFKLSWLKDPTTEEIEILYQPVVGDSPPLLESNKGDIPVCERIHWQRELIPVQDLPQNKTHYYYVVVRLQPHTKYRCLVKTFGREESHEARSELLVITTLPDIPAPPQLKILKKSFDFLVIQWLYENREDELVDFYRLDVFEILYRKAIVDQRDYCEDPMKPYNDFHNEDYDDCCSRQQEDREDDRFKQELRKEFGCSLDHKENCERISLEESGDNVGNVLMTKRLEHRENNYTIRSLDRFHTYAIQIQACNRAGCGSFSTLIERTNYSLAADKMYDLTACKKTHSNEYRVHFKEPKKPNGLIITYALHFRNFDSTQGPYLSHMHCLTRWEHENNSFLYVGHLNGAYNQIAVRVESLGHRLFTDWMEITHCGDNNDKAALNNGSDFPIWKIFFVFFLVGCASCISWICYKRRCWRWIPRIRRYVPLEISWSNTLAVEDRPLDDRQMLVAEFHSMRFVNSAEGMLIH